MEKTIWLSRLGLLLGIACIGFSAIFVRLAAIPGVVSAFYRVFIASLVLMPLWLARQPTLPDRSTLFYSILSGIFFGLDLAFWNASLFLTSAATSTVLAYLAPIWVGLAARLILKEKFKKYYWWGVILAMAGILVIMDPGKIKGLSFNSGNILAICSSFFYAGYLLTAQLARKKIKTLAFTSISVLVSTAVLLGLCLLRGESLGRFSLSTWLALLGLGLVSHLSGWLAINYALGHIKAAIASVTLLGQPVITALLAIPLLHESVSLNQLVGGLLILAGICFVNRL